jgi:hypothetical protein
MPDGKLVAEQYFSVTASDWMTGLFDPFCMLQHLHFHWLHTVSEIMYRKLMGVDAVFQH